MAKQKSIDELLTEYKIEREYLADAYEVRQLSLPKIKLEKGIPFKATIRLLRHFGIPIRSISESRKTKTFRREYSETLKTKYGVDNISQSSVIKERKRQTFLKHYGVDNVWKSEEFKKQINTIMLGKYGVLRKTDGEKTSIALKNKSPEERIEIESKKRQTNLDKYGTEFPQSLDHNKVKARSRMKRFWENLNDDERNELCISFSCSWDEERREEKRKSNKVFWESLSDEEKQLRLKKLHSGIKSVSSLETRVQKLLNTWKSADKTFSYIPQFYIKSSSYDFLINGNIILEIQGDYWHANPKHYIDTDEFHFSHGKFTAKDVWEQDEKKRKLAVDSGYKICYIWESEMGNLSDEDLEQLLFNKIDENFTVGN